MKDLYTKKLSGPPLPHDEWVKRHQKQEIDALDETEVVDPPEDLHKLTKAELLERAKASGVEADESQTKAEIVAAIEAKK